MAYVLSFTLAWSLSAIPLEILLWSVALATVLVWLTVVDLKSLRLPNAGTLSLFALGLLATLRLNPNDIAWHTLAGLGAYVLIVATNMFWRASYGTSGIGGGDAKLLMAAGAWTGPAGAVSVLLISTVTALLAFAIAAAVHPGVNRKTRIPFGLFLGFAVWMTWLFGAVV